MAEHAVGDKVTLKDDGQSYTVVGVRTENRVILYDLEKGNADLKATLTVMPSQIEVQKLYAPKYPKVVVYAKKEK